MPTLDEFEQRAQGRQGAPSVPPPPPAPAGPSALGTRGPRPPGPPSLEDFERRSKGVPPSGPATPATPLAPSTPPPPDRQAGTGANAFVGAIMRGEEPRAPAPSGAAANAVKPLTDFPDVYKRVSTENWHEMTDAYKKFWKHETWLGEAWGVLQDLGTTAQYAFSPVQAGIETFVGEPVEAVVPKNPLLTAKNIGQWGSFAAQLAAGDPAAAVSRFPSLSKIQGLKGVGDPLQLATRAAEAVGESKFGSNVKAALSPTSIETKVPRLIADPANPGKQIPLRDQQGNILYDRSPQAREASRVITKHRAGEALSARQYRKELEGQVGPAWFERLMGSLTGQPARSSLERFRAVVQGLDHDQRLDFMMRMAGERAGPMPTGLQPLADKLREVIDKAEARLVSIGALNHATQAYWPRLFKNPNKAEDELAQHMSSATARAPLRGSRGRAGLKQRTVPTLQESLDKGLELVTDNPIDYAIMRLDGMNKWYYGHKIMEDLKKLPYVQFVPWYREYAAQQGQFGGHGMEKLNDQAFRATLPPAQFTHSFYKEIEHTEGFDPQTRAGLNSVAKFLGVDVSRPLRENDPFLKAEPDTLGYANRKGKVVSLFGMPDTVIMHEIGHQLEFQSEAGKLGTGPSLSKYFQAVPKAWDELENLALQRTTYTKNQLLSGGKEAVKTYRYLTNKDERIANLFHAFWNAPTLLKHIAPTADAMLRRWLRDPSRKALLAEVAKVKPGVQVSSDTRIQKIEENIEKFFPGIRHLGTWMAPDPVARIFNNYVNPSKINRDLYDAIRNFGTTLNNVQLGLSAFHAGMVSIDASSSALAGLMNAKNLTSPSYLAHTALSVLPGVGPVYAGIRRTAQGMKYRHALLDENDPFRSTPEFQKFMKAFEVAGGRVNMDLLHSSSGMGSLWNPVWHGYALDAIKDTLAQTKTQTPVLRQTKQALDGVGRVLDTVMDPIMERFVPNVKVGVLQDMVKTWNEANPQASEKEFGEAMVKLWDSVDNRMGQLVYDNLFWSQTLKQAAFMLVRSVGWNLGTEREIGGGIVDAIRNTGRLLRGSTEAEFTERMKYTIAFPVVVAIQGAMINYMFTGHGPKEFLDYFYPRNNKLTPDGTPERIALPSYVKDMFAYYADTKGTIFNKLHPLGEIAREMYTGKDYYGDPIVSPVDDRWAGLQMLDYAMNTLTPFSVKGWKRQHKEGADLFPQIMSLFGFVPAPISITDPQKEANYKAVQDIKGFRKREKDRAKQ